MLRIQTLLLLLALLADMAEAQDNLPVVRSGGSPVEIWVDGKKNPGAWLVNPSLRPDIFMTSAGKVVFCTGTDSIAFDVEKNGVYDFVILVNDRDSAFTRVQWVSDNPLEEPSDAIRKRAGNGLLSREQCAFDIDALVYTLTQVHPDLFYTISQDSFFNAVRQTKESLPDSLTSLELYKSVAPLVAMIGDGHTQLGFPYNDVFTAQLKRLPLFVRVLPDYTLRVAVCIDNTIPAEAEVLSINGKTAREMLERMVAFESGEREFFRLETLNRDFTALFTMLYAADSYEVEYRLKGKKNINKVRLEAALWEELNRRINVGKQPLVEDYSYTIQSDKSIAVMDFRNFNDVRRMEAFADSMFADLRTQGIQNLIIDIRKNGGGNSRVGDVLLRYISPRPFIQMAKALVRVTPTTIRLIGKDRAGKTTPGWYYSNHENTSWIVPDSSASGHYRGRVFLLTSHYTFSASASFAWAFKQFGMGTVIGEETGGMNVSFGDYIRYRLPVSGLLCSISYKRFWHYGADDDDIHGTIPDVEVTSENALETAIKMARKKKKR